MSDSFSEVTTTSWLSRLKSAGSGALIGLMLFVAAFPLLFWNEGRAIHRAKTLEEGAGLVVSVDSYEINPGNKEKLVHLSGNVTTDETLTEPVFGFSLTDTLKLRRIAEMYQWQEKQQSETTEKLGGGTETKTTYTYRQGWADRLADSTQFKQPDGHHNPTAMRFESADISAKQVKLNAFTLSSGLIAKLNRYEALPMTDVYLQKVPATLAGQTGAGKLSVNGGNFYFGQNPLQPQVGDVRIRFEVVRPATASVVAKQTATGLAPYTTQVGGTLEMLEYDTVSAADMFAHEVSANKTMTWLIRGGGLLAMFIGLNMIFNVLRTLTAVLPFLANIVGFLGGLVALLISVAFSLITIAVAWLFYRPVLGVALLAIAGGSLYFLKFARKQEESVT